MAEMTWPSGLAVARRRSAELSMDDRFEREALPHLEALYRFARRLAGSKPEAEDLVQDTLLRAVRSFHTYHPGTNCRAWLFRIMRNLQVSAWQSRARAPVQSSLEDAEEYFLYDRILETRRTVQDNPELVFLETQAPEVREALGRLPEEYRSAVLLCDVEGFSYAEIAEILDVPIGTVRSRISRGRGRLQEMLWEYVSRERPDLAAAAGP